MSYSQEFRESAVKRLFEPNCEGLKPLAKELGVMPHTLRKWRDQFGDAGDVPMGKTKKKRPQDWSAEEKYQAVMETGVLNEEERSTYCRRNGIFEHHLDLWREQCLAAMRKGPKVDVEKKQLETKLKTVTKELNRKDKALAEAAALLVLQKKIQNIYKELDDEGR